MFKTFLRSSCEGQFLDLYLKAGKREAAIRLIKNMETQMAPQDKLDITDAYLAVTSRFTHLDKLDTGDICTILTKWRIIFCLPPKIAIGKDNMLTIIKLRKRHKIFCKEVLWKEFLL